MFGHTLTVAGRLYMTRGRKLDLHTYVCLNLVCCPETVSFQIYRVVPIALWSTNWWKHIACGPVYYVSNGPPFVSHEYFRTILFEFFDAIFIGGRIFHHHRHHKINRGKIPFFDSFITFAVLRTIICVVYRIWIFLFSGIFLAIMINTNTTCKWHVSS